MWQKHLNWFIVSFRKTRGIPDTIFFSKISHSVNKECWLLSEYVDSDLVADDVIAKTNQLCQLHYEGTLCTLAMYPIHSVNPVFDIFELSSAHACRVERVKDNTNNVSYFDPFYTTKWNNYVSIFVVLLFLLFFDSFDHNVYWLHIFMSKFGFSEALEWHSISF